MDYLYDVFFSYKRDRESDAWHETVKTKLHYWLKLELQRQDVQIFFDTEDIKTGVDWRKKMADSLKRSRCILCVWSPLYFRSRWCVSEWMTFVERERVAHCDLVVPVRYFDGESFPALATAKHSRDFSQFTSTLPMFWKTESAVDFENQILKPFAHELAQTILNAPPYDDGFPVVEVPEDGVTPEQPIRRPAGD